MKKSILLLFAVLLLLAACGTETEQAEPTASRGAVQAGTFELTVPPEDKNPAVEREFVETNDVCYYTCEKWVGDATMDFVYFCPRGGDTFRPLCGKPNCKHADENCNACVGYSPVQLGYYDGFLYTTDHSGDTAIKLVKMNLDGTDHQVVAQVDGSNGMRSFTCQYEFHHGKFFIYYFPGPGESREDRQERRLIVVDLRDYSQSEPFAEYFRTAERFPDGMHSFCSDKLYGFSYDLTQESLFELDLTTGMMREITAKNSCGMCATDSTLYYFAEDPSADPYLQGYETQKAEPGFRELDLASGTVKYCGMPIEDICTVSYGNDYIYARNTFGIEKEESTLYILNRDYEPVDQIKLSAGMRFAAAASDRIYIAEGYPISTISYYIDKAQLGSGELTLIPIETIG